MGRQFVHDVKSVDLAQILKDEIFTNYSVVLSLREIKVELHSKQVDIDDKGFDLELDDAIRRLLKEGYLDWNCVQHKIKFWSEEEWCLLKFGKK